MGRLISIIVLVIISAVVYNSWKGGGTNKTISEISSPYGRYDGKIITVIGRVSSVAGVLGLGGFTIEDSTGDIFILSKNGLPAIGETIKVTGTYRQAFVFNDKTYSLIVRD